MNVRVGLRRDLGTDDMPRIDARAMMVGVAVILVVVIADTRAFTA